ncbi:MAG: DUF2877 domain-containing protein [Dethiobacteria bacterium]|nr:DUF2877 domain-containing protein [Dethiobacteria bacterium]
MKTAEPYFIEANWYAADLDSCSTRSKISRLSIHNHVINFRVDAWPHLLIVADSQLERGPATIGCSDYKFSKITGIAREMDSGWFEPFKIQLSGAAGEASLNWRAAEPCYFSPPKISVFNRVTLLKTVEAYLALLRMMTHHSAAAVLLGLPGGEDYFRQEISNNLPDLLNALVTDSEKDFIKACRNLIGMGKGFSPTGDDLIHGALVAYHSFMNDNNFIVKISGSFHELFTQTNFIGQHMLEMGWKGKASEAMTAFMLTLNDGAVDKSALSRVLKIGSGSGFEMAIAILLYVKTMLQQ